MSKKEESIGSISDILKDCQGTSIDWAESNQKLDAIRELKKRLNQMDYGRLLATSKSQKGESTSTSDTTRRHS